jgi:outer membrane receptor protein involved in Fe transport
MFNPKMIFLTLLLILSPIYLTSTVAQTSTATLSGTVVDANGAVITNAAVSVTDPAKGLKRDVTTNESGQFAVPLLPPGKYSLLIRRDGFTTVEVPDIVLNVGDQKSLQVALKVGDVKAAIEVRPDETLVNTSPAVATTIDRTFVSNLPLNGRSFQSLILLTPGVVATPSNGDHPGEFSVNGQRQNANYFTVDGVSANTGVGAGSGSIQFSVQAGGSLPGTTALGTTASLVSIDALEEFKIQTSTYSAEYGRQPGAQVQLVTRSGTNDFHGTAFDYLRNEKFDANNWFTNSQPLTDEQIAQGITKQPRQPLRQNQFGGTFSGPVMLPRFGEGGKPYWSGRNKTFFFFSYEGQRLLIPLVSTGQFVPSLRLRAAAASALQPFLNAYPVPSGPETMIGLDPRLPIDPDPESPTYNPAVPSGMAPFNTSFSNPSAVDATSIRVDHTVNSKLTLFGRYGDTPSSSLQRSMNLLTGNVVSARTLTLGATLSVSSELNNQFRFNWSSNESRSNRSMDNFGGAVPLTLSQLISGYSGAGVKLGIMDICTQDYLNCFQSLSLGDTARNHSRQLNIIDNVLWVKGSHQLRFGIDWRRLNATYGPYAYLQDVAFANENQLTNATADYIEFDAKKEARPIYDNYSVYLQDTWKLSPRLTLDLGLRYEINPAPHDANGVRPVVLTGINGTDVSHVTIAPPNAPFYKTFKTAFAPRVGVAYLLNQTSGRETVLRGGFGVYYDLGSGMASSLFGRYPFSAISSPSDLSFPISPALAQPPPFNPVPTQLPIPGQTSQSFYALSPDLKLPYTLQWNLGLEQSIGNQQAVSLSYVGAAGRNLIGTQSLNFGVNPNNFSTRPNRNVGRINYIVNGPTSDYHSLQAQYQRRFSHGLQALVNYTWSHAIDQVSNEVLQGTLERGNADFDVRHNFSAAVTYDVPKLSGSNRIVKALSNGWSLDSVFFARTGTPLDLFAGLVPSPEGMFVTSRPDVILGVPFWIKNPAAPGGRQLNRAAFAFPGTNGIVAHQGSLGRNVVRLAGIYQVNMALRRQFKLGERLNLQIKAEAFNVFNHPLFGAYQNGIGAFDFGKARSMLSNTLSDSSGGGGLNSLYQIGGPRSMQLSLRISF